MSGMERVTQRLARSFCGCALLCSLWLATACERANALDTPDGEAWCGRVTLGGPYRTGFSPRVQMRLVVDASLLDTESSPGRITTFDAGEEVAPRLLDEVALRPMRALAHDPLSQLQLGQGRELNYLFAVSPNDAGHESLLVIVSLRNDERVEVRLLRPGAEAAKDDLFRQPLFGVFLLQRRSGDCGF